jgi:hypothetical protein
VQGHARNPRQFRASTASRFAFNCMCE